MRHEFVDVRVAPGIRYYKVQDVPASGGSTMVGPGRPSIPLGNNALGDSYVGRSLRPCPMCGSGQTQRRSSQANATVLWQTDNVQVYFDGEL